MKQPREPFEGFADRALVALDDAQRGERMLADPAARLRVAAARGGCARATMRTKSGTGASEVTGIRLTWDA